jgi:hypothetical protein
VLRSYVRRLGDTADSGHCIAVVRTPDGLLIHDDFRKPFLIAEEDLSTEDGSISDKIRFGYYEKVTDDGSAV